MGRGLPGKLTCQRGLRQTRHPPSQVDRDQQVECFGIFSAIAAVCAWALSAGVVMVNINFRSVYAYSKN